MPEPAGSEWFTGAGLGMFVHWDHASQQGLEISWPMVGGLFALPHCQDVSVADYHASAATFDPKQWDPHALAVMAREAGMRYVVFTARHHSGYAMFRTRLSTFSVEHSPYGRDIVGELVEAVRAEGLRVGVYLSLSDWSHPDYPPFADEHRPYLFGLSPPPPPPEVWAGYVDYLFGQVRELLTGYGPVDVLWFDGGWERSAQHWRARELAELARSLQPGILINDRLPGCGDFDTPEQFVPPLPPARPWETCMTMNESWGYNPGDHDYKSATDVIHAACEVRARGGNLLLNVSPTGEGAVPAEQRAVLAELGRWMSANGESIHDAGPALEPWQFYGPTTRRGDRIYLHLLARPYTAVTVRGVHVRRVGAVSVLATGERLDFTGRTGILDSLTTDPLGELRIMVPPEALDPHATVVAVDFDGGP